jgi:UDP-N-acetylglucosamine--N-acetylmuramyl-(pentapeptide) pyrophosphoryl-undecaprenol N-acetylglucosamine transferase
MRILLVSEGSGGHLVPAAETAGLLASGGDLVRLWYAQRAGLGDLAQCLTQPAADAGVVIEPIDVPTRGGAFSRLWFAARLFEKSRRFCAEFRPEVVVGFGGWISLPVLASARSRRIRTLLHEQNRLMGRSNRLLAGWVDGVATSFPDTRGIPSKARVVVTGMPVRRELLQASEHSDRESFGLAAGRPTILILGGSQGARALNRLMMDLVEKISSQEAATWQVLHLSGLGDEAQLSRCYTQLGIRSWVAPFCADMVSAYAAADVVVSRSGASTLAELMVCGKPALLIPYPHAQAHQEVNAEWLGERGLAWVRLQEEASAENILEDLRALLADEGLRERMRDGLKRLAAVDAAHRLARAIRRKDWSLPDKETTSVNGEEELARDGRGIAYAR